MTWLDGITDSVDMSLSKLREMVKRRKLGMLLSKRSQRVGRNLATEQYRKLWPRAGSAQPSGFVNNVLLQLSHIHYLCII